MKRRKGHFFPEFSDSIGPAKADLPVVFMMEMSGLHIRIGGDFTHLPMPQAIKATIRDDLRPLVQLRLTFGDKDKASGFMQHWPGVRKKLLDMFVLRVLGYRDLLKRIDFARAGEREVYLEVRAEPGEIARLSKFLSRLVENNFRHFLPQPGDWPEADAGEGDTDDVDLDGEALADGDPDAARPPMEGAGKAGPDAAADLPSSSDGSRSKAPKLKLWRTR